MKIINDNKMCKFEELEPGSCFKCEDAFYMKVNGGGDVNAVELSAGQLVTFELYDDVKPVIIDGVIRE